MISIIIPVYNQHEMTKQCIDSIVKNTDDYEIIVVDNGSSPSIEEWYHTTKYADWIWIKAIRNETNLGFPMAVNRGIRAAKGDIICLINNDTVVTPGWLKGLTDALESGYDIVGPMTNYVAGLQKASTALYEDEETLSLATKEWSEKNKGAVQEVNFVIGFCMVFKKTLFEKLGDFDESMWPCSGEEIDFCFRCREAGGKIGIIRDVYIHHYGSQTFGAMQSAGTINYQTICKKCDAHLEKKWGGGFWEKQGLVLADFWVKCDPLTTNDISCEDKIRLNLGCGRFKLQGFRNIDQFENVNPDLVCDALKLPYSDGTVDEIYCGHMLEHLDREDGLKALMYWKALLKPGGKITVTVPDFDVFASDYFRNPTPAKLVDLNEIFIYSYCQESHHKYCYSGDLLKKTMEEAGFKELKRLPQNHPYFVDPVDWQVAYEGRK